MTGKAWRQVWIIALHSWSGYMTIINHHRYLTGLGATQFAYSMCVLFLPRGLKNCYWDVTVSIKWLFLHLQWKLQNYKYPQNSHFLSCDNFCEREHIQLARAAFLLFPQTCSWHWIWVNPSPDYELKNYKRKTKDSQRC